MAWRELLINAYEDEDYNAGCSARRLMSLAVTSFSILLIGDRAIETRAVMKAAKRKSPTRMHFIEWLLVIVRRHHIVVMV